MCNLTNWLLAASLLTLPGCSDKDNPASPGEQKVLTGDLDIDSQAELDSLGVKMGSVGTIIAGDLAIHNIIDLSALAGLSRVGGDLMILRNDSLLTLNGFQNLTTVIGSLTIGFNFKLTDLDSLASLRRVGVALNLLSNPSLVSIKGLEAIDHVGGSVEISNNGSLDAAAVQALIDSLVAGGFEGEITVQGNME